MLGTCSTGDGGSIDDDTSNGTGIVVAGVTIGPYHLVVYDSVVNKVPAEGHGMSSKGGWLNPTVVGGHDGTYSTHVVSEKVGVDVDGEVSTEVTKG